MAKERRHHRYRNAMLVLAALLVILNAAGLSTTFCDWYMSHLYPTLTAPLSHLLSCTDVPVGELIMYAAIIMVAVAALLALGLLAFCKRKGYRRLTAGWAKTLLAVILCGLLLFTFNWSLPFRASGLAQQLDGGQHTLEQLQSLRNQVVEGMNAASAAAPRDEDGNLDYGDDTNTRVAQAMKDFSTEFSLLKGYYPAPKAALCSDVLEWMDIGGYTYPYTQEITYNRYVSKLYYPVLAAHESAHHKGYFLESDATFLSCVALVKSNDAVLQLSGWHGMYSYVEAAYEQALVDTLGLDAAKVVFAQQPQLSNEVRADLNLAAQQRQEYYEKNVNKEAQETFQKAAQDAADVGWSTQGKILDENSYDGVVGLLLDYCFPAE